MLCYIKRKNKNKLHLTTFLSLISARYTAGRQATTAQHKNSAAKAIILTFIKSVNFWFLYILWPLSGSLQSLSLRINILPKCHHVGQLLFLFLWIATPCSIKTKKIFHLLYRSSVVYTKSFTENHRIHLRQYNMYIYKQIEVQTHSTFPYFAYVCRWQQWLTKFKLRTHYTISPKRNA